MVLNRIKFLYLFAIFILITKNLVFSQTLDYPVSYELVNYISTVSKEITRLIPIKADIGSGELKISLLLSPEGNLKDAYILESSGNQDLDQECLKAVWRIKTFPELPAEWAQKDLWLDIPIILETQEGPLVSTYTVKYSEPGPEETDQQLSLRGNPPSVIAWPNPSPVIASERSERSNLKDRPGAGSATEAISEERLLRPFGARNDIGAGARNDGYQSTYEVSTMKIEIDEAIEVALENHMPARIALEEINLAKLKVREARRALFPAASLNYMETEGDIAGGMASFKDKEYKLRFEQPLYYGWRLKFAVDQAMVNLEAQRFGYEKIVQDLKLEVELAYWTYVATKMGLKLQEDLHRDALDILDIAKKKFEKGYSTKAEYLEVQSQYTQIGYQIASSQNEFEIARMNLLQAMNQDSDVDLEVEQELKINKIELNLEQCLELANKFRPDLKVKELMVSFSDYEKKIVKSKDQLKVDLTGSYGRSGGAYVTESLTLREDWYLGLKATKPFEGNTVSTSYTKDKTAPKYGQTTRTVSTSKAIELGLLDNLAHFSEDKAAEINYQKSLDELQNLKENIYKEVKEAFLNYKKALVQVESNLNKVKFKEEELKISKARVELNEASISELLRAKMGLADEKNFYIEALGSLNQSLARLDKATGYAIVRK